jgi:predicted tellurium resistance membrane protein TerC
MLELLSVENLIALVTLTVLEIVLGIDNIIFISIMAGKLPPEERQKARVWGLTLAMITRVGLLCSIVWVMKLTQPLFSVLDHEVTGRDLVLMLGGLFLLAKSTHEIHDTLETHEAEEIKEKASSKFLSVILQIAVLDIVFSLDSVITAIGMADHIPVMITAVMIAVVFMLFFSKAISEFVERHPTIKMLALSFLILIGVSLVAEGLHHHIPKGYIYFAMAFSVFVEMLNLKLRKPKKVAHT